MKSVNINKISRSINCSNGKKLKFEGVNQEDGICNIGRIKKNFDDQCEGRDSCILDNSLLGCQGYDFDLAYSCFDDSDNVSCTDSSISLAISQSKKQKINRMIDSDFYRQIDDSLSNLTSEETGNITQERSLIYNQEDEQEVPLIINEQDDQMFIEGERAPATYTTKISFWDRFKHWIIGVMIVLILVAIVIAGYMFFSKENKPIEINLTPLSMMEDLEKE